MHGRNITIYRTFHNVKNGANLSIHTWLLSLEDIYKTNNCLPDIIYHQIDGGSENVNQTVHAICELLVARKLCKKVILTRLLKGRLYL